MRKGRVLVVDDSASERRAVATALLAGGDIEAVHEAADGPTGLRQMVELAPDLVICDLRLPGFDGLQLLRFHSAQPALAVIPIIMLTSESSPERKVEIFARGASDYVTKPFDARELVARVRVHLTLRIVQEDLRKAYVQLERLSCTDPLTSISNRRHFDSVLAAEVARLNRYGDPLSLLLFDLDHFKHVNDNLGHAAGDRVLKDVASTLQRSIRSSDVLARFGGEELTVILANTAVDGAVVLAERLRIAVSELRFEGYEALRVTTSVGVAQGLPTGDAAASIVERADHALYEAKRRGRNCTVVFDGSPRRED